MWKKVINNKELYQLFIKIQNYIVCLYFDFKPCCDNIKSEKGNNFTFFTINFKKNIAEDDYITNYSSILNNKKVKKQGLY